MSHAAEDLYHAHILAHDREPRNEGDITCPTHRARRSNPLCGDRIEIQLVMEDTVVKAAGFVGRGCALCRASASILTERIQGVSTEEARTLAYEFEGWLRGQHEVPSMLAEFEAFEGVRKFPSRIPCAVLPWESLLEAFVSPQDG